MSLHMLGAASLAPSGGAVVMVTINPSAPSVQVGQKQQFSAIATDARGNAFAPPVVSWTAVGSGTIDPSGLFTPTGPGSCTITARVGTVTGQTVVTVTSTDPTGSSKAPSLDDEEDEEHPEAETKDDLQFPRQGFPSFHASPMEIDPQPRVLRSMLDHFPDMYDLEHRPWGVNAPEDAAFEWAGLTETEEKADEEGIDFVGHGGGGGGGHGGGHGHGGGGGRFRGGFGPGWGWGWGPYYDPVEIDDEMTPGDVDAIADLVAEKVAQKAAFVSNVDVGCLHMLGASGMPTVSQLRPYFLTDYPVSGDQLTALYEGYLRAFDGLLDNIHSLWHPVTTAAVLVSLHAARDVVAESWAKGGIDAIVAVQMLAGIIGWFNASYVDEDGNVKWDALNQPVNAGVIQGAQTAAQGVVDAAKKAGQIAGDVLQKGEDALSTAWWTTMLLVVGGLIVVGLLGWKFLGSDVGRAAVAKYLPGKR